VADSQLCAWRPPPDRHAKSTGQVLLQPTELYGTMKNTASHRFNAAAALWVATEDTAYYNDANTLYANVRGGLGYRVWDWDNPVATGTILLAVAAPGQGKEQYRSQLADFVKRWTTMTCALTLCTLTD
jgi:hypothetical protein